MKANTRKRESGQALVFLAITLVGLLGFAALAIDGGNLYTEQRRAQAAADNSVMAAAFSQMRYGKTATTSDLEQAALGHAVLNGYDNNQSNNWVVFYRPPLHGPYAGNDRYMEVQITQHVNTSLAHIVFGQSPIPLTVYAVAHGIQVGPIMGGYAIAAMQTGCHSNQFTPRGGTGSIIKDGGVFVNNDPDCDVSIDTSGSGAHIATTNSEFCPNDSSAATCTITGEFPIHIGGDQTGSNSVTCSSPPDWWSSPGSSCNFYPAPTPFQPQVTLEDIGFEITTASFTCGANMDHLISGSGTINLVPGSYTSMNSSGGNASLVLAPGVYCITGVGSSNRILNNRAIKGHGVFIYIQQPAAEFDFSGSGILDLSAPFSGENGLNCDDDPDPLCAVEGVVIFKPDGMTDVNGCGTNSRIEIGFSGSSEMIVRGMIWAPESYMVYTGNGHLYMIGQAIVGCVKYAGGGEMDITFSSDDTYRRLPSIRLDE